MTAGFISRSHRAIAPFELHRPDKAADAAALIAQGAVAHAGGIDVVERLQGGQEVDQVVALAGVGGLSGIAARQGSLHIGALVTHDRLESESIVHEHRPDIAAAWATVGNVRIRRTGTVGGNLMALDPTYDAAPILAAADATLHFVAADGSTTTRTVADRAGPGLLTAVEVPLAGRVSFDRSLKPVVSVAVGTYKIAIGCAIETLTVVEYHGQGSSLADQARSVVGQLDGFIDDSNASASYRRRMTEVLIRRGLQVLRD